MSVSQGSKSPSAVFEDHNIAIWRSGIASDGEVGYATNYVCVESVLKLGGLTLLSLCRRGFVMHSSLSVFALHPLYLRLQALSSNPPDDIKVCSSRRANW